MTSDPIDRLRIASPCKVPWSAMAGDDRARFCAHCEKHVYNIAAMTSDDVGDLIRRTEGSFCARLYRRRDGTVLTADCPVGAEGVFLRTGAPDLILCGDRPRVLHDPGLPEGGLRPVARLASDGTGRDLLGLEGLGHGRPGRGRNPEAEFHHRHSCPDARSAPRPDVLAPDQRSDHGSRPPPAP